MQSIFIKIPIIGKLIIETDEVEWIFEVRGTHLDYKPPEIKD